MHDVIIVGIPLIAILAGILFNKQDNTQLRNDMRSELSAIRSELNSRFSAVDHRLDSIQRDLREFYSDQARHDVRIAALEQK